MTELEHRVEGWDGGNVPGDSAFCAPGRVRLPGPRQAGGVTVRAAMTSPRLSSLGSWRARPCAPKTPTSPPTTHSSAAGAPDPKLSIRSADLLLGTPGKPSFNHIKCKHLRRLH